jgi:hypothetical protein
MNSHRPITPAGSGQSLSEVEGQIREAIGRELAPSPKPPAEAESGAGSISSIIQRVAGSSVKEINRLEGELQELVAELQGLRELLQNEGQRVQREIAGYAHLSQLAMNSTAVLDDGMNKWKAAVENVRRSG